MKHYTIKLLLENIGGNLCDLGFGHEFFRYNLQSTFHERKKREKLTFIKSKDVWDFPGGAVVKNPPANAGDTGSSPGPGRSHMPWSN